MREHDPGYGALRRAARAALVMPAMFAIGDRVIGNPAVATFAAFGSFAMLLLVDFAGEMQDRLLDQAALGVACGVLIALATLVSRTTWLAAAVMAAVAFVILFAAAVSSVLAGATTSLLLSFILPVSLAGPVSSIPDRVAGWGLAVGASLLAIWVLWPAPAHDPVRTLAIAACRALARRLRAHVSFASGERGGAEEEALRLATASADDAVQAMERAFFAAPYRPTGLSSEARAAIRLVDELRWLNTVVLRAAPKPHPPPGVAEVWAVKLATAEVLDPSANLLDAPTGPRERLTVALERMRDALAALERQTIALAPGKDGRMAGSSVDVVSSLDPSFRAQELGFVVGQIATNVEFAAAAARRSWIDRVLGRQPAGFQSTLAAAQERAGAQLARGSVQFQNSLRAAAALGLAVLVADLASAQHGFWVVLGTLSVLRSNALSTGQNVVRALVGTAVGFAIGGFVVYVVGTNTAVLWTLLPVAILFAGLAPSAISFAAGQAAFTLTLLILYNIIVPEGWKIGLLRVEDIALGCAVSLAVGLMFWPRGARAALGRALAQAYTDSASYLAAAVAYGVACCDPTGPGSSPPEREAVDAAASSRRLDVAFRGYLGERGSKPAPLAEITKLVTGVAGLRLAGDAVRDLWDGTGAPDGDRSVARQELTGTATSIQDWYGHLAASLADDQPVPEPLPPDRTADGRLAQAVARDLRGPDGDATATGVRVIWTADHLDAVRRLQETLTEPARAAT
jgi:hypothetical protein